MRLARAATRWVWAGGRGGGVVPGASLLTRGCHFSGRLHPVCSRVPLTSLPVSNGSKQHYSCHDAQHLQVQDDFFTHLHARDQMEGSLSLLILLSAQWDDDTSIRYVVEQARAAGVRPSGYTMERVLNVYIKKKRLDAAVGLYKSIKAEYSEVSLETCTVLYFCTLLVENEKCCEALQTLREFVESVKRPEVSQKDCTENCRILLSTAAKTESYEVVKELFDLLSGRLVDPGPQIVAPLLQCKLDRGDMQGTVEVAEHIYSNFNTLPKRMEVLIRLMQHNPPTEENLLPVLRRDGSQPSHNADLLERMFDLVQDCYGVTQAQHDLLFACLESGYPTAARLVLQTLADNVDGRQVLRMCKLYAKNEREAALEHLLAASKGMTNIDRPKICDNLLDAYKRSNKNVGEKAMSLWTSMQEEALAPSSTFRSTLATLL